MRFISWLMCILFFAGRALGQDIGSSTAPKVDFDAVVKELSERPMDAVYEAEAKRIAWNRWRESFPLTVKLVDVPVGIAEGAVNCFQTLLDLGQGIMGGIGIPVGESHWMNRVQWTRTDWGSASASLIVPFIVFALIARMLCRVPGRIAVNRRNINSDAIRVTATIGVFVWPLWLVALIWAHLGEDKSEKLSCDTPKRPPSRLRRLLDGFKDVVNPK